MNVIELNKNEIKEYNRIKQFKDLDKDYAQRSADIWLRSAATGKAQDRRQTALKLLGLDDTINYW